MSAASCVPCTSLARKRRYSPADAPLHCLQLRRKRCCKRTGRSSKALSHLPPEERCVLLCVLCSVNATVAARALFHWLLASYAHAPPSTCIVAVFSIIVSTASLEACLSLVLACVANVAARITSRVGRVCCNAYAALCTEMRIRCAIKRFSAEPPPMEIFCEPSTVSRLDGVCR